MTIDFDYATHDPTYDESYLEEDHILDSERECEKIDMGFYDEPSFVEDYDEEND